jgi:hypothetical protein
MPVAVSRSSRALRIDNLSPHADRGPPNGAVASLYRLIEIPGTVIGINRKRCAAPTFLGPI